MFTSLASSSSGNLYTVSDGRSRLLLEAGLPFPKLQKALCFNLNLYSAALITHSHRDHSESAAELCRRGMDVWCSAGTALEIGLEAETERAVAGQVIRIGSFTVLPFRVVHDTAEPLGYLIGSVTGGKLLFATDTCYLPNRFEGLTEIAVECNHDRKLLMESSIPDGEKRRIMNTHMEIGTFLDFLRANDLSRVQAIHLLHMSDARGDAEGFKRKVQEETGKVVYVC
jgi:phosphoribosyl 1,2-cyclic phosphodiesterase